LGPDRELWCATGVDVSSGVGDALSEVSKLLAERIEVALVEASARPARLARRRDVEQHDLDLLHARHRSGAQRERPKLPRRARSADVACSGFPVDDDGDGPPTLGAEPDGHHVGGAVRLGRSEWPILSADVVSDDAPNARLDVVGQRNFGSHVVNVEALKLGDHLGDGLKLVVLIHFGAERLQAQATTVSVEPDDRGNCGVDARPALRRFARLAELR
jgi:hypothetical protein